MAILSDTQFRAWYSEFNELGEGRVREMLPELTEHVPYGGETPTAKGKAAQNWLARKDREREEAHRKTEALQAQDLVDLAQEANRIAKEAAEGAAEANRIAGEANYAAREANRIAGDALGEAKGANQLATNANRFSRWAAAGAVGAFLLSALAFAKSMGWF